MTYMLDDLLRDAFGLTLALFVTAGATLLLSAASALGSLIGSGPRTRGRRLALSVPPLVAFAALVIVIVCLVGDARAEHVAVIRDPADPSLAALQLASALSVQLNGLWLGSVLVVFVGPLALFGGALPWSVAGSRARPAATGGERARPRDLPRAIAVVAGGSAVILVVVAQAVVRYAGATILAFGAVANADPGIKAAMLSRGMEEAGASLDSARLVLGAAALLAALGGSFFAARAARDGSIAGTRTLIAAAGAAALGVLALVATRGMAHDASHPVPVADVASVSFPSHVEPLFLERCEPLTAAIPVLVVSEAETRMDGRILATPEDATRDLETLRRNWSLLHPGEPAADSVGIASDERTPAAAIAPWLRAAQAAGVRHVEILSARSTTIATETLGPLERRVPCALRFSLDAEGAPVGQYPSWRAIASAAGSGRLRVAP